MIMQEQRKMLKMKDLPLFDLNFDEKEIEAASQTIRDGWISMGPKCLEFEKRFATMIGSKYACAVTNCTAALHLACVVAGLGENDEVICPSLTFVATVNCIRYVGATPVFADIKSSDNLCIDPEDIRSLITPRTKAIIPMHYAGFSCDMDSIMQIAKDHNLFVIEDACHGPLSVYHGKKLGSIGNVGCFSFFSNKNISTGEGGMIVTDSEEIYDKLKLLRSHGMTTMSYQRAQGHATSYDVVELGYNYRLDDIRASIGISQLDKLRADIEKRAQIRGWYIDELSDNDNVIIPFWDNEEFSSNYIFPIVLKDSDYQKRDRIREYLKNEGIQTSVHYPAVHRFSCYRKYSRCLPNTEYIADNEITLPMYAGLQKQHIKMVCDKIRIACNDVW